MWCFPLQTRLVKVLKASCDPCYFSFFLHWSYVVEGHLIPHPTLALFKKNMITSLHPLLIFPVVTQGVRGHKYYGLNNIAGGHLDMAACWRRCSNKEKMARSQSSTQQRTRQRKGTKGRKGSILKLQQLLTHIVFCTAEKN